MQVNFNERSFLSKPFVEREKEDKKPSNSQGTVQNLTNGIFSGSSFNSSIGPSWFQQQPTTNSTWTKAGEGDVFSDKTPWGSSEAPEQKLILKRKREDTDTIQKPNKERKIDQQTSIGIWERTYPFMEGSGTIESSHRTQPLFDDKDIIEVRARSTNKYNEKSVARTRSGNALLQQQTTSFSAACATCVEMFKGDRGIVVDWSSTGMGRSDLQSTESIKQALEQHGMVVSVDENVSYEELIKSYFRNGAMISIKDDHGPHMIIVGQIDKNRNKVYVRDPYHGWSITITLDALKKAVGDSTTVIQTKYRTPPPASMFDRKYPPGGGTDTKLENDFGEFESDHGKFLCFKDEDIKKVLGQSLPVNSKIPYKECPIFKTPSGKSVLQQKGARGCTAACVEMLKADCGKEVDYTHMLQSNFGNSNLMQSAFRKSGINVLVRENVAFEELGDCLKKNGSASIYVNLDGVGTHEIILDEINYSEKTAHIRDPYHGWAIVITLDSLKKVVRGSTETIQVIR